MGSISICRLCLNSERRTFLINNTVLQETLEKLTDVRFDTNDGRPLLACYVCCAQLRNSYRLRQRALKAQELFAKYVVNIDFEDSKKLVSLIVSKTHDVDYNHAFEEQYNFECMQKDPNAVEVKKEIKDEEDIDNKEFGKLFVYTCETVAAEEELKDEIKIPKEEIQDITDHEDAESDIDNLNTGNLPEGEEDPLGNNGMEMIQEEVQVVLEKTDTSETTETYDAEGIQIKTEDIKEERKSPINVIACQPMEISITFVGHNSGNEHAVDNVTLKYDTNHEVFSCKLCEYECVTRTAFKVHLRDEHSEEKVYLCDLCNYSSEIKSSLIRHLKFHHRKERNYSCRTCQKKFSTKTDLRNHLRTHTGEKPFTCDMCDYKTAHSGSLNRHVKLIHRKERNYACVKCQKDFCTKGNLKRHLRTHTGEKPYMCDLCDYKTTDGDSLKKHLIVKHGKETNHVCHICSKGFSTSIRLNIHLCKHTGEKPYKCDLCDYRTANKSSINSHVKFTHNKEKNHSCPICKKRFTTKVHLNRHTRVHTGEKPYKCDLCVYKTSDSGSLKKHLQCKHRNPTNYLCVICEKKCDSKSHLDAHKIVHTDKKLYVCDICGLECSVKNYLKAHILSKHTIVKSLP